MICPHCQRTIAEENRYLMSVDRDAPGLRGILRGEGGQLWKTFTVVSLTVLAILIYVAVQGAPLG